MTAQHPQRPTADHPVHAAPTMDAPHEREILYTWQLGEVTDDCGRTGTAVAELGVSHNRNRKAFTAFLSAGLRHADGGTSFSYRLDRPSWSISEPVARYSGPRLAAFALRALQELRSADPAAIAYAFVADGGQA